MRDDVHLSLVLCCAGLLAIAGCGGKAPPAAPALPDLVVEAPPVDPSQVPPGAAPVHAGGRVVVVAPLHMKTDDQDATLGESLGEILAVALADQKNVVVVDRQKLAQVMQEQKLSLSGLIEPATAARVGKLLLAELVVAGSIVESEGKLRYAIHVITVDGQRVLGSAQCDGTRKDFDRAALELSSRLAAIAGVKLPPIKPEELDDSPVGRLHLMRGISFYYANNPDQAIVNCLRAVQLDPRLQEARLWIARSYLRQNEKEHARAELKLLARNPAAVPLVPQVQQLLKECGPEPTEPDLVPPKKN
jgi:TolB-like protein